MTGTATRIGIVILLVSFWAASAAAQPARGLQEPPVISLCEACDELQKQVIDKQLAMRDSARALEEARTSLAKASAAASNAQDALDSLPRGATAVQRQTAQANVTAHDAAVKAAQAAFQKANSAWNSAVRQYAESYAQLQTCNEQCPNGAGPGQPTGTGTGVTAGAGGDTAQQDPGPPQCPNCARLLEELHRLNHLIWLWNDSLNGMRERLDKLKADAEKRSGEWKLLDDEARQTIDASVRLSKAEYDQRVNQLKSASFEAGLEAFHLQEEMEGVRDTLRQLRKERDEWWPKWNGCNRSCNPKRTQWFTNPWIWIPIAGAAVGTTVAGGGDAATPPAVSTTPPTVSTPPSVTTPPSPPLTPAPPSRRPAAVLNVTGCTCVNNSANFDVSLQTCQRLRQIRTTGSGNSMTLSGDASLPTFQGTFNASTGEFELAATMTIDGVASNVAIAGTVETDGNIHNLRVSFGGTAGRQTLYQLTTTPVP